jgi:SAM-dependent methyltransferase
MDDRSPQAVKDAYHQVAETLFAPGEIALGPWTSHSLIHDPKHLSFVLARYKFCARMLHGRRTVLEVGVGDGFGLPLVAQAVGHLVAIDWDPRLLEGNARRLAHLKNVTYLHADLNEKAPDLQVDAAYTVDVLEHIDPAVEARFVQNLVRCLKPAGVLLTGTPNITAAAHASPQSQALHINLKSMDSLRTLMERYFENVFLFGMNDEIVHTGYAPMCHYLWALAVGVRPEYVRER